MDPLIKGPEGVGTRVNQGVVSVARSGVRNTALLTAGQTQVLPIGAFNWTITILTGTATVDGAAVPAGFSASDESAALTTLSIVMDSPGTAFVSWFTP